MNNKELYFALGGAKTRKKLNKAREEYLNTLPYDAGVSARKVSGRYFNLGGPEIAQLSLQGINIVKDGLKNIENAKTYEDIKQQRQNYNNGVLSGISDNDALMSAFNNAYWASGNSEASDYGSPTWSSAIGDMTSAASAAGGLSGYNPWIMGGAAVLAGGKNLFQWGRANRQSKLENDDADKFNAALASQFAKVADNVDASNDRRVMQDFLNYNYAAYGGEKGTHGSDFTSGLTFIGEGGTHEENPNGGVPAGIAPDGEMNLVEEGEVIWDNDYVFSNRLKVPADLANKYKLDGDLSFAEAIEKATKESKQRPNDPISNATNRAIINEFMDAQEAIREEKQRKAAKKFIDAYGEDAFLQQLAMLNGQQPEGIQGFDVSALSPQGGNEMLPPGMADGGHKFVSGGRKRLENGLYVVYNKGSNNTVVHHYEDEKGRNLGSDEAKALILNSRNSGTEITPATVTAERTRRTRETPKSTGYSGTGDEGYAATQGYATQSRRATRQNKRANSEYTGAPDETGLPDGLTVIYSKGRDGMQGPVHHYETSDGKNMGSNRERAIRAQEELNGTAPSAESTSERPVETKATKQALRNVQSEQTAVTESTNQRQETSSTRRRYYPVSRYSDRPNQGTTESQTDDWHVSVQRAGSNNPEDTDFIGPRLRGTGRGTGRGRRSTTNTLLETTLNEALKASGYDPNKSMEEYLFEATKAMTPYISERLEAPATNANIPIPRSIPVPNTELQRMRDARGRDLQNPPADNTRDQLHPATVASGMQAFADALTSPDFSNADAMIDEARALQTPVNIPIETIGDYRRRNPFDEKYLVNMANANRAAALRSLDNTTGGNQSARLANVLNYFNQRDLGEVARQAYLANRADDAQVAEFNRGTNLQNMSAINHRNMAQAQLNSQRQAQGFQGIANGLAMRQNIQDRWDANSGATMNAFIQNLENEERNKEILNALGFSLTNKVFGTGENPWAKNGGKLKKKRRF